MKVILRDMETGLYVNGAGSWGDSQSGALAFENSIAALEFCVTQKLHNVEILLLIGDPRVDVPLRLFPRDPALAGLPRQARPQETAAQMQAL